MSDKKKLEAILDALSDSLEIISHNKIETEYVLFLRGKYQAHYHQLTGEYYTRREIEDTFPTKEWIDEMDNRFRSVK